jgi:hypothetical protein
MLAGECMPVQQLHSVLVLQSQPSKPSLDGKLAVVCNKTTQAAKLTLATGRVYFMGTADFALGSA